MALDPTSTKSPGNAVVDQSAQIDPRTAGQHWLRALEQARAEALSKTQSVFSVVADSAPDASIAVSEQSNASSRMESRHAAGTHDTSRHAHAVFASADTRGQPVVSQVAPSARYFNAASAFAGATPRELEALIVEELSAARRNDVRGEANWDASNVFVESGDEGVTLWLRDAGLTPAEVKRILQRAERHLAEAGLRLHRLYVNGDLMSGDNEPQDEQSRRG